ncbi:hypothetical protein NIES2119_19635 [[Phormidium ambiguum] IAM M-71]|uniref:Uncharacterized protein n=1 Tax=[Phormidium ambiguum] IAM M-71 TaxID=454136 RepID=A0A1U7IFB3_9CYAN|nr:hypothetical protein [Phormidium ambiguum]OKH35711.1 hypothetical protein NIES2119_19635 [Phormidium ambiguum IAM M-71]
MTELNNSFGFMPEINFLNVTRSVLRGGGSSWRIYYASISGEIITLIARHTIAKMFEVSTTTVQKYIINYNLPILQVKLLAPNKRKQISLTLLSTAVHYWKHLYKTRQLSHLPKRTDESWKKFMADCENLNCQKILQQSNAIQNFDCSNKLSKNCDSVQFGVLFDCLIESIGTLSVIVDLQHNYWITLHSGLSVIDASPEWLDKDLKFSPKKKRLLQQRGFSGKYEQHFYRNPHGHICCDTTLSFGDWLIIWAYFAFQKNQKSITLLKLLAQKSLTELVTNKKHN